MKMPWHNRTGLAKAAAILATIFTISLGLCGMNVLAALYGAGSRPGAGQLLVVTGIAELVGMAASLLGLIVVGLLYIARALRTPVPPPPGNEGGEK